MTNEEFLAGIKDRWFWGATDADLDRLLALARKGAAVQWRPIAEAPKDRTILVCGGTFDWDDSYGENVQLKNTAMVIWDDYNGPDYPFNWRGDNTGGHDTYYRYNPTHWMEVPSALEQAP